METKNGSTNTYSAGQCFKAITAVFNCTFTENSSLSDVYTGDFGVQNVTGNGIFK
jgi:hypothetical protein